jgi:uncharacterized protein YcbK (DUF882 family)
LVNSFSFFKVKRKKEKEKGKKMEIEKKEEIEEKKEEEKRGEEKAEKALTYAIINRLKKIEKELIEIKKLLFEVPEIKKIISEKEKEEIIFAFKSKRGNEFQAKIKVKLEEIEKKEEKRPEFKVVSPLEELRKRLFELAKKKSC